MAMSVLRVLDAPHRLERCLQLPSERATEHEVGVGFTMCTPCLSHRLWMQLMNLPICFA